MQEVIFLTQVAECVSVHSGHICSKLLLETKVEHYISFLFRIMLNYMWTLHVTSPDSTISYLITDEMKFH